MTEIPGLDLRAPPFDLLGARAHELLADSVDIAWFPAGRVLIESGKASPEVYVVSKGRVQAADLHEGMERHFSDYGPGDVIGAFAVIMGRARHRYVASEDTVCVQVPADLFRTLVREQPRFGAWFHEGLAAKQHLLAEREQGSELAQLMLTRVSDAQLAPAVRVPAGTGIAAAVQRLREQRVDGLLVGEDGDDAQALGIVTRTDLLDALALDAAPRESAVGVLASRPLVCVRADEVLFQALVLMTERGIERVVVCEGERVVGTLGMAEVLAHYASHSHLISLRLARARTLEDIATAAAGMEPLVRTLHAQGARMATLGELVSALNSRILQQVFDLLVPAEHRTGLCLLVMGSEGRREQILKTDQDNALVLADGYDWPGLDHAMQAFSQALARIGYPPCPGRVMVDNPRWRMRQSQWRERIGHWRREAGPQGQLDLSIAIDARPVAGDAALFAPVQQVMLDLGRDALFLRQMAQAIQVFDTPLTLLGRLRGGEAGIDLKKGGIFPIVHGLRTLALQHGIALHGSDERADALVAARALPAALAEDVKQTLAVLQRLRLGQQLEDRAKGLAAGNHVDTSALRHLDRDLLRDALRVVNAFKEHVRHVFQLER